VVVQGRFRRFRTAEAWLANGSLTVVAAGPKCSLGLVNIPLAATVPAELPGTAVVVTCESFLRPVQSYGSCRLGGGRGIDYYFSIVAVRCPGYDEETQRPSRKWPSAGGPGRGYTLVMTTARMRYPSDLIPNPSDSLP
jgi:hypothetical protein